MSPGNGYGSEKDSSESPGMRRAGIYEWNDDNVDGETGVDDDGAAGNGVEDTRAQRSHRSHHRETGQESQRNQGQVRRQDYRF